MGVKGLWRLLLPIGRRISIETLEGKVLAVDASIWMTQFLKAMRDPESGAVRPAAHIIGFFRRLCRLRFHGIKPVFVFDGATPEIKRRELAARRKRRDQFVATHGPAAIQRMAKKLLVDQLKKTKAKMTVSPTKSVKITAQATSGGGQGGAFVSGFNLPEGSKPSRPTKDSKKENGSDRGAKKETDDTPEVVDVDDTTNDASKFEMTDEGVIITGVSKPPKPPFDDDDDDDDDDANNNNNEDGNDWDKPITNEADEHAGDDGQPPSSSDNNNNSNNDHVEYDDVLWTSRQRRHKKRKKKLGNDELLDIDFVSSLPPADRKDAIEEAKKRQRMRSRREFMPVAANADGYSQAQLRNFLRSSKLNQEIVKMAKKAVHHDSRLYGEVTASDRTRRVIFQKDGDDDNNAGIRSNPQNDGSDSRHGDENDTNSESSDEEGENNGFLSTRERPSHARRLLTKNSKQQSSGETSSPRHHRLRKVGGKMATSNASDDDDDDDDSDNEGAGFFPEKGQGTMAKKVHSRPQSSKKRPVIEDVDDESDVSDAGGGFVIHEQNSGNEGSLAARKPMPTREPRKALYSDSNDSAEGGGFLRGTCKSKASMPPNEPISTIPAASSRFGNIFRGGSDVDDDDSSQEGGGFLRGKPVVSNRAQLKTTGLDSEVIVIDEDDNQVSVHDRSDANMVQELQDQMLAKALQEEEDAQAAAGYAGTTTEDATSDTALVDSTVAGVIATSASDAISNKKQTPGGSATVAETPAAASSNILLAGDHDSEEDDIDWESGDFDEASTDIADEKKTSEVETSHKPADQERDIPYDDMQDAKDAGQYVNGSKMKAKPLVRCDKPKPPVQTREQLETEAKSFVETEEVDSDCVAREDGDGKNDESVLAEHNSVSVPAATKYEKMDRDNFSDQRSDSEKEDNDNSSGLILRQRQDADEGQKFGTEQGIDDFGGKQGDENAAAFQQAEATASNLTNWAGRAVRRAIAEYSHAGSVDQSKKKEEHGESPPHSQKDEKASVTSTSVQKLDILNGDVTNGNSNVDDHGFLFNEEKTEEAAQMLRDYETELAENSTGNIERETDTVTDEMQAEVMQLLQLFGIPFIQAPAEAEAQCVALEKLGLVSGVVTEDSDVFVFGGRTVYKNIFDDQKYVEVYLAEDAEREMGLGHNEMVALAMLLGGDYTEGVKGVGIVNGMEIVSSFEVSSNLKAGLQKFREWLDGFEPFVEAKARKDSDARKLTKEQKFHNKHRTARTRWNAPETFPSDSVISAYMNPVVDKSEGRFSWAVPDMENIIIFCSRHAGWPAEETRRILEPVVKRVQTNSRQTRIDSFMRYEDSIKFANIRSKRLRDVLGAVKEDDQEGSTQRELGEEESPAATETTKKKRNKNTGKARGTKRRRTNNKK